MTPKIYLITANAINEASTLNEAAISGDVIINVHRRKCAEI
jgi:hypothetical protein